MRCRTSRRGCWRMWLAWTGALPPHPARCVLKACLLCDFSLNIFTCEWVESLEFGAGLQAW